MSYDPYDPRASFKWFDYFPLRDAIDRKTAQINNDYTLVFGSRNTKLKSEPVDTGYCDFESRRCWVNAETANVPADPFRPWAKKHDATEQEEYTTTTYIAAHERAHARWTDFEMEDFEIKGTTPVVKVGQKDGKQYDLLLHNVWNILEDERIERLIERDFPHLRGDMVLGSRTMLRKGAQPEDFLYQGVVKGTKVPQDPNDPNLILSWVLRRRVLRRAGMREACPLSPHNQQKLKEIEPLLRKAFKANSSREVVTIAREIIEKLQIKQYNEAMQKLMQQLMSAMGGMRKPGDKSKGRGKGQSDEQGTVQRAGSGEPSERRGSERAPGEGGGEDEDPDEGSGEDEGDSEGRGKQGEQAEKDAKSKFDSTGYSDASNTMKKRRHRHRAAPYIDIQNSVRSFLGGMKSLFQHEDTKAGVDFDRTGSRLDLRRAMRQDAEPFRVPSPPTRPGKIAISLIIDESGSMGGNKEEQAKRVAMLFYEALRYQHQITIAVAPSGEILATNRDGEIGKGFIAGYDSNSGTSFNEVLTREMQALDKDTTCTVKYAVLIADGESGSHDGDLCRKAVKTYGRRGVRAIGIGLDLSSGGDDFFKGIFGDAYVSINRAEQLLPTMSKILRTVAAKAKRQRILK